MFIIQSKTNPTKFWTEIHGDPCWDSRELATIYLTQTVQLPKNGKLVPLAAGMKRVRVNLSAMTRESYATTVLVPNEMRNNRLQDVAKMISDDVDGGEYESDMYFWDDNQPEASLQSDNETDVPTHIVQVDDYGEPLDVKRLKLPEEPEKPAVTRTVEYYRCWPYGRGTGGQWDTADIEIPGDTPDDQIEAAIRDAVSRSEWGPDGPPAFVGLYHDPGSELDGEDD